MKGAPHRLTSAAILTDNGLVHDEVLALFSEIFCSKFRQPMPVIPAEECAD